MYILRLTHLQYPPVRKALLMTGMALRFPVTDTAASADTAVLAAAAAVTDTAVSAAAADTAVSASAAEMPE